MTETSTPALSTAQPEDFFQLLKPRVMSVVIFTAFVGLVVAGGDIDWISAAIAILCIAVGAGAAGALNMALEGETDALMRRTRGRPVAAGRVKTVPIGKVNMPVRSFIVDPDGSYPLIAGLPAKIRGIAFSGYGRVVRVEVSTDDGQTWRRATLGADYGPYSFRTYEFTWRPERPGTYVLAVRATDEKGNVQPDSGVWNPSGYLWNKIERQEVVVLAAK